MRMWLVCRAGLGRVLRHGPRAHHRQACRACGRALRPSRGTVRAAEPLTCGAETGFVNVASGACLPARSLPPPPPPPPPRPPPPPGRHRRSSMFTSSICAPVFYLLPRHLERRLVLVVQDQLREPCVQLVTSHRSPRRLARTGLRPAGERLEAAEPEPRRDRGQGRGLARPAPPPAMARMCAGARAAEPPAKSEELGAARRTQHAGDEPRALPRGTERVGQAGVGMGADTKQSATRDSSRDVRAGAPRRRARS